MQIAEIPTPQPRPNVIACVCQRFNVLDLNIIGVNDAELAAIAAINMDTANLRPVASIFI